MLKRLFPTLHEPIAEWLHAGILEWGIRVIALVMLLSPLSKIAYEVMVAYGFASAPVCNTPCF